MCQCQFQHICASASGSICASASIYMCQCQHIYVPVQQNIPGAAGPGMFNSVREILKENFANQAFTALSVCVFDQSASINCTVSNHHPLQERVQRNRVVLHHVVYKLHGSEIPVFRTFTDGLEPSSAEEKGEEEPCGGCVVAVITARSHTQSRKV